MDDGHDAERAQLIAEIEAETRGTASWTGRSRLHPRVIEALRRVRREDFVPAAVRGDAYVNAPLPIGHGQTISQPFIVALMTDLLEPAPGDIVLEIGTGSGYQSAVLSGLVLQLCSIEVVPELAARARHALERAGCRNVVLRCGDGALGWPERAPFDGIIVTAAAPAVPPSLVAQLRPGGRMVIPLGPPEGPQRLVLLRKDAAGTTSATDLLAVAFVPLVAASD